MPVGTRGAVRGLTAGDLVDVGAQIVLANTYHLWVRPGSDVIRDLGGLHVLMGWSGPILTDSGGYQVHSLREHVTLDETGARFRSPEDGAWRTLTPEGAVHIQEDLGVDVAMALDECIEWPAERARVEQSTKRTTRWLQRARDARRHPERTALFGIVQGGTYPDLRAAHAALLAEMDLDGIAIGGLSVGEDPASRLQATEIAAAELPTDRPRYLMGVGRPIDLVQSIERGVDVFDCVLPTRAGRHGQAWTPSGRRNLRNAAYARDPRPLDPSCPCVACTTLPRAALRHHAMVDEAVGKRLLTLHNLTYVFGLLRRVRRAILAGDEAAWTTLVAEAERATALARPEDAG